ncbi:MAG: bifunctional pyr operon transcriptional regulator/uracil phosphoribosyltransferase PyrR [Leadbetterella sp.]
MQKKRLILKSSLLDITIQRLCQEIIEHLDTSRETVLLGLQPRGIYFADRIHSTLKSQFKLDLPLGYLDATFYRDDVNRKGHILKPNANRVDFLIEDKNVLLLDDVLATGRMVRAAIDAMQAFGRPAKIQLMTLISRSHTRDLPIEPNFVGKKVNTVLNERVLVEWKAQGAENDAVWLLED